MMKSYRKSKNLKSFKDKSATLIKSSVAQNESKRSKMKSIILKSKSMSSVA